MKMKLKNMYFLGLLFSLFIPAMRAMNRTQAFEQVQKRLGSHLVSVTSPEQIQNERCPLCHLTFEGIPLEHLCMIKCGNHKLIFNRRCLVSWAQSHNPFLCLLCQENLEYDMAQEVKMNTRRVGHALILGAVGLYIFKERNNLPLKPDYFSLLLPFVALPIWVVQTAMENPLSTRQLCALLTMMVLYHLFMPNHPQAQ